MVNTLKIDQSFGGAAVQLLSDRRGWLDTVQRGLTFDYLEQPDTHKYWGQTISIIDAASHEDFPLEVLLASGSKLLVYGGFLHSARVIALLAEGVNGYLSELAHRSEFLRAMTVVLDGMQVAPFQLPEGRSTFSAGVLKLTAAEHRAARAYFLDMAGFGRATVAASLGLSEKTLGNHLLAIRRKVRAQAGESRAAVSRRISAAGILT